MTYGIDDRENLRFFWQVELPIAGVILGLALSALVAVIGHVAGPGVDIAPWMLWLVWLNGIAARIALGRPRA